MRVFLNNLKRRKEGSLFLSEQADNLHGQSDLIRTLKLKDLIAFGVAAIIGAGIFSTIGNASASGGPGVSLLFIFTALACGLSALCYAQFASTIPVAGSAYTYAYASFGELAAWIIGWDLLMEYAIGNIAVAISWSDYFTAVMGGVGLPIPLYLTMDYLSASNGYDSALSLLANGAAFSSLPQNLQITYTAWTSAPQIAGIRLVADIPALTITALITYLVYVGIQESKRTANVLVLLKLLVILLVITVGAFYVSTDNWTPFAPNGISGIMKGVSAVFFAYIGFDAISTTAEECENPKRDLPKAMIITLLVCTVLYVLLALVLTGMVPYQELRVGDPLAYVFSRINLDAMAGIVAFSAVIAMASVLLVFQYGQPRIWMTMSRDGLLPKAFSRIHPKHKTPGFATIVTGFVVAIPALFMNLTEVTDLTSIGTLFAFILVCGGILVLDEKDKENGGNIPNGFRVPYINGKYIIPILLITSLGAIYLHSPSSLISFFTSIQSWNGLAAQTPFIVFVVVALILGMLTYLKNLSLIPVLGLLTNLYLMSELGLTNWSRFLAWLAFGLIIYFAYGYRKSKLHTSAVTPNHN